MYIYIYIYIGIHIQRERERYMCVCIYIYIYIYTYTYIHRCSSVDHEFGFGTQEGARKSYRWTRLPSRGTHTAVARRTGLDFDGAVELSKQSTPTGIDQLNPSMWVSFTAQHVLSVVTTLIVLRI